MSIKLFISTGCRVFCCVYVESPLSDRKLMTAGDDVTSRLGDIWRQARELKSEAQLLRQAHVEHVTWTKQLLQATFIKLKVGRYFCRPFRPN